MKLAVVRLVCFLSRQQTIRRVLAATQIVHSRLPSSDVVSERDNGHHRGPIRRVADLARTLAQRLGYLQPALSDVRSLYQMTHNPTLTSPSGDLLGKLDWLNVSCEKCGGLDDTTLPVWSNNSDLMPS